MNPADLIKKKRIERNFTQEYVANQIGVSTKTLSRIENQKRPIKLFELKSICDVLNMDPNCFMENDEDKKLLEDPTNNSNFKDYGKYLSPAQFISEIKDIEFKLLILKGKLYQELKHNF